MISIAKPWIGAEEKQAVMDVMDSGMIASGDVVRQFENEFAALLGVEHAIATTSGTTALEVAFRALGIGAGDKVLTTPFSFIASTNSILYTGATPVFADIDMATFNLDPKAIEETLIADPSIKALLIVHLFGQACNMDEIMRLVQQYNLILVEDCAQSHMACWKGRPVGTFGDAGCFSFYPTKNMTTGEGGAVVTRSAKVDEACRLLINHGMKVRYYHDVVGYNYRMTNIAAAIGRCQLKKLPRFNEIRRAHAAQLDAGIRNPLIVMPFVHSDAHHVYHQYSVRVLENRRDDFLAHLQENGIGYGVFYPLSIPEQVCYASFQFPTVWKHTDQAKCEVVSLPVHPALTDEEIQTVVRVINAFA